MDFSFLHGMRVLVTGATGFVGRHLIPELIRSGVIVTCLVRANSNTSFLPRNVRKVQANLSTGVGLPEALAGQDAVIHMAALLFGLGWQDYLQANTRAAEMLAYASAHSPSVQRLVLVSSLAATGPNHQSPGAQDTDTPSPVSAYGWSKFMAEQIFAKHLGNKLVTLRPPIIYGSGDKGLLPCFQAAQRGFLLSPGLHRPFPISAVHAKDMVQAVQLCLLSKAHGVYHINDGHEYTMKSFNLAMGTALGTKAHIIAMPLPIMAAAAVASTAFAQLFRMGAQGKRAPSWNMDKYREAKQLGWLCDATRIMTELGYTPNITLQAGMAEAVAGYRQEGWL